MPPLPRGQHNRGINDVAAAHRGEQNARSECLAQVKGCNLNVLPSDQNREFVLPRRATPCLSQRASRNRDRLRDSLEMIEQRQHHLTRTFECDQGAGVEREARRFGGVRPMRRNCSSAHW